MSQRYLSPSRVDGERDKKDEARNEGRGKVIKKFQTKRKQCTGAWMWTRREDRENGGVLIETLMRRRETG